MKVFSAEPGLANTLLGVGRRPGRNLLSAFRFQVSAFLPCGRWVRNTGSFFRVERGIVTVLVVALGRRRSKSKEDIYELTRKLLRLGLIDLPK